VRARRAIVIFIMGDNGASAEGTMQGTTNEVATAGNGVTETQPYLLSMMDQLGGPLTYNHYPVGWAHAMDSPMQWTKQVASHFGGSRNGMVISWPARIKDKGGLRPQGTPVVEDYVDKMPFPFTGTLKKFVVILEPEKLSEEERKHLLEEEARAGMAIQ
jgi:hypothetical protein